MMPCWPGNRSSSERGILTAILSNMGDSVHANIEREFDWLSRFDALVWSYQLRIAKPDPAIYRHVLEGTGHAARRDALYRRQEINIVAALALGMKGILVYDDRSVARRSDCARA